MRAATSEQKRGQGTGEDLAFTETLIIFVRHTLSVRDF